MWDKWNRSACGPRSERQRARLNRAILSVVDSEEGGHGELVSAGREVNAVKETDGDRHVPLQPLPARFSFGNTDTRLWASHTRYRAVVQLQDQTRLSR